MLLKKNLFGIWLIQRIDQETPNFDYLLTYFHRILRASLGASSLDAPINGMLHALSSDASFLKTSCEEISFQKNSWKKISFYEISFERISVQQMSFQKMSFQKMSFLKISFEKISFEKISFQQISSCYGGYGMHLADNLFWLN